MTTAERLEQYYPFDQEVIDAVADVAERDAGFTSEYERYKAITLNAGGSYYHQEENLIDIRPKESDSSAALMIHLAMGQPLDPNNYFQIATIAAANPNTRILASGNPSGIGHFAPKFTHAERKAMANRDFRPIYEPRMRYAESEGIEDLSQYGYSFGADPAMEAATSDAFNAPHVIALEPVTLLAHGLAGLGIAFGKTGGALDGYVDQSGPLYLEAREKSLSLGNFSIGLARLSNLAISKGLSQGQFESRTARALVAQPDMHATIAWAADSEFKHDESAIEQVDKLQAYFGNSRVSDIRLEGQKHALANDVYLQAAIVAQGLRA